jgi:hypothetical protein
MRVKVLIHVDACVQREKVGDVYRGCLCARACMSLAAVSEFPCAPGRARAIAAPLAARASGAQQKGANGGKC